MIVAVLPVEQTELPIVMVVVPPFARCITVLLCIFVDDGVNAVRPGVVVDFVWSQTVVEYLP